MALTKAQRARLDKLATYLEGLPEDYVHFDMRDFIAGDDDNAAVIHYARHNGGVQSCGTAACAAGHGPAAGVPVPPRLISAGGFISWHSYCRLFTGSVEDTEDWCFSGAWGSADNSHYGAAARIRYLLDKGAPPEGFGSCQYS